MVILKHLRLFPFDIKAISSFVAIFYFFSLSYHCFHSSHIYEMGLYDLSSKEIVSGLI